jgi:hypothetical protein
MNSSKIGISTFQFQNSQNVYFLANVEMTEFGNDVGDCTNHTMMRLRDLTETKKVDPVPEPEEYHAIPRQRIRLDDTVATNQVPSKSDEVIPIHFDEPLPIQPMTNHIVAQMLDVQTPEDVVLLPRNQLDARKLNPVQEHLPIVHPELSERSKPRRVGRPRSKPPKSNPGTDKTVQMWYDSPIDFQMVSRAAMKKGNPNVPPESRWEVIEDKLGTSSGTQGYMAPGHVTMKWKGPVEKNYMEDYQLYTLNQERHSLTVLQGDGKLTELGGSMRRAREENERTKVARVKTEGKLEDLMSNFLSGMQSKQK